MREEEINLSSGRDDRKKLVKQFLSPAFIFFAAVFAIAVILIAFLFFLRVELSSLVFQSRNVRAQIDSLSTKKGKLLISVERLSSIRKIIGDRNDLDTLLASVLNEIPDTFNLDAISSTTEELVIVLSSDSLSEFANLLSERIPKMTSNKALGIESVKIDSFTQDQNVYSLSLTFALKK